MWVNVHLSLVLFNLYLSLTLFYIIFPLHLPYIQHLHLLLISIHHYTFSWFIIYAINAKRRHLCPLPSSPPSLQFVFALLWLFSHSYLYIPPILPLLFPPASVSPITLLSSLFKVSGFSVGLPSDTRSEAESRRLEMLIGSHWPLVLPSQQRTSPSLSFSPCSPLPPLFLYRFTVLSPLLLPPVLLLFLASSFLFLSFSLRCCHFLVSSLQFPLLSPYLASCPLPCTFYNFSPLICLFPSFFLIISCKPLPHFFLSFFPSLFPSSCFFFSGIFYLHLSIFHLSAT